ncbi:hypothetical protein BDY17DRAFT_93726 [Neohortaea acidophila]|uniref:F-box domain-containing protein n=1 Tax=Neohortaea acidophila TaxID=245834 RepID=A0A6A6Q0G9_9PEZI|nr:uncharacterized protein BDY17DRAFT_93726 [Neohortaea acidophila]KAF2484917.1 hypothetical protein BDY17DRAFT_93726 [Neohortaea acidophila]
MAQYTLNLLHLPPELRNKIYELVLNDTTDTTDAIVCPFILQCSPGKRKYGYSLTQTCHLLRDETLHMWHASSKLLFAMRADNMKYYVNWLRRRPAEVFASIRRIQLEDYQHCRIRSPERHPSFCRNAIVINLTKRMPVSVRKDRKCRDCPRHDSAADWVHAVVRSLEWKNGRWALTREKLEQIFEAAAW